MRDDLYCYRNVELAAMDQVRRFPSQVAFTIADFLQTINDHLGEDGGQSDEIIVPEPGGTFFEYEEEWEEKEEDEDYGY